MEEVTTSSLIPIISSVTADPCDILEDDIEQSVGTEKMSKRKTYTGYEFALDEDAARKGTELENVQKVVDSISGCGGENQARKRRRKGDIHMRNSGDHRQCQCEGDAAFPVMRKTYLLMLSLRQPSALHSSPIQRPKMPYLLQSITEEVMEDFQIAYPCWLRPCRYIWNALRKKRFLMP